MTSLPTEHIDVPEWVDATEALDVAWSDHVDGPTLEDVKKSRAITDIGAEARVAATLEEAGVPLRRVEMPGHHEVDHTAGAMLLPATRDGGWYYFRIPGWSALILESTIHRSARQIRALKQAHADPEWRAAAICVWRLGGISALTKWIHSPGSRTGSIG